MSVQSVNESIDNKIGETNAEIDQSVQIRRDAHNRQMQEELEEFDEKYLSKEEREKIAELNEAEKKQLKESGKDAFRSVKGAVQVVTGGVIGKALGAVDAADHAQRFNDSEDKLREIDDTKTAIRESAKARQESAKAQQLEEGSKIADGNISEESAEVNYENSR